MEKGARRTGKTAWEIARARTPRRSSPTSSALNIEDPTCCAARPTTSRSRSRSSPDLEANGFTYRTSDGIYFDTAKQPTTATSRASTCRAGSRQARGHRREAQRRPTSRCGSSAARRETADGMGQPVGRRLPGLAHRVLGDGAEISRRLSSTSTAAAKTTSRSITRTRSRRPRRAPARASRTSGCTATSCCSTTRRWRSRPASSCAWPRWSSARSARLSLPVPDRPLPHAAQSSRWEALDAAATALDRMRHSTSRSANPANPTQCRSSASGTKSTTISTCRARSRWPGRSRAAICRSRRQGHAPRVRSRARPRPRSLGTQGARRPARGSRARRRARRSPQGEDWAEADRLRKAIEEAGFTVNDGNGKYELRRR